ncbi:aldehyde dehydrogenase family protein [Burkholderia vietnamiensis]|uniref:aldehyde dehydrogenase family protein n=1 Tax=Burkholderia vietnamiensis TaxID=60552 RepID=UPI001B9E6EB0|nr:aldehyde dehydrogenase family protein [Burkholderia vietnamiensis]MBR8203370.1 aldehyde dehydrogenase family protein [Burkholderia vietnamiensis]
MNRIDIDDTDSQTIDTIFARQLPTALRLRESDAAVRIRKLKRLCDAVLERQDAFYAAFHEDLRKPRVEVNLTELLPIVDEARHAVRRLSRWIRPRRVAPTMTTIGTSARVVYQPRGRCLIMGPWNYPLNTLVGPLVSAVAAGNTVILKSSELTPHVSAVIGELVRDVFDPDEVAVIHGGVSTAQHLLTLPFDHVFFTGSPAVGKTVMAAAAKHLASVTLELGGKSPVIVDETADLARAAELIVWGKLTNSGQSCVAPDHVYVHRDVKDRLVELCKSEIKRRYDARDGLAPALGRMINEHHAGRVGALIENAVALGARLAAGGAYDTEARYVAPTLLTDVPTDACIWSEEIFGPVLPIEPFDSLEAVIDRINAAPKPLALYLWSRRRNVMEQVSKQTSSGGFCINHCMQHYAHTGLPFGGVNNSGLGSAHGYFGFKAFSHERAVLKGGLLMLVRQFFPPYTNRKIKLSSMLLRLTARG